MIQCPKCSAGNPLNSRFCNSCGQELSSLSQAPTVAAPEGEAPPSPVDAPHVGRIVSSDSVPAGGFTPGTILADRYRIIGLLGRGGMGEVYRADDLKLGQPVALKFLPPALAEDSVRRERFFAEVRITRQLSHPNICRVYDIGEVDGRHFLSMEYIDGEDLASLMKRIGHLSNEKALDIARQLVAGLSVAHERGVLHRDLKPANIMLDGHGRVRITDFGLAIAVGDESQAEEIAGTPAYMAPEQLAGKGATVRSDIYSLGLILYEIYTGKKAFKAKTLAELREQKETQTPRAPSEIREGIDPVVERLIQRCMEKDPNARPASVAQLAAALPGGDPLAAAIAAGETPSPEMVAASGSREGLKPWIAWTCLAVILLCIGATVPLKEQVALYERVPIKYGPDALVMKAQDILKSVGYSDLHVDSTSGFEPNRLYLDFIEENDQFPDRFDNLPPFAIQFWYRQSPKSLQRTIASFEPIPNITQEDFPLKYNGDSLVVLDSLGNLISIQIIPPKGMLSETVDQPDWSPLFEAAGIDQEDFNKRQSNKTYLTYGNTRVAWIEKEPNQPDNPVRIEAAALGDKPVFWQLITPSVVSASNIQVSPLAEKMSIAAWYVGLVLIVIGGIFFARQNLRAGRGDRRSAARLAYCILGLQAVSWIFIEHHVASSGEMNLLIFAIGRGVVISGLVWLMYIALEPFVRRRWPDVLISWNRVLGGNFRDPLVSRDLLIGCVYGAFTGLVHYLRYPLTLFFNEPQLRPSTGGLMDAAPGTFGLFRGLHMFIGGGLSVASGITLACLGICFIFFLVRYLSRRTWIAITVIMVWITLALFVQESVISIIPILLSMGVFTFVYFRYGLLAITTGVIFLNFLVIFPITTQFSAWYSKFGLIGLALLLIVTLYAFYTSLGDRPMFGTPRLDD
jgi:hypothetical protein